MCSRSSRLAKSSQNYDERVCKSLAMHRLRKNRGSADLYRRLPGPQGRVRLCVRARECAISALARAPSGERVRSARAPARLDKAARWRMGTLLPNFATRGAEGMGGEFAVSRNPPAPCSLAGDGGHGTVRPMRELLILAIHLLVTLVKLLRPGGVRAVAGESLVLKHKLLIINRSRQATITLASDDLIILLGPLYRHRHRIQR